MIVLRSQKLAPAAFLVGLLALTASCRRDEVSHFRVEKRANPRPGPAFAGGQAPGPAMPANMAGDVPPPPSPEGASALKWTLPKGWTESRGGGGMRFASMKPAVAGTVDVSVIVLPGPAGGELANVNRWRGQIGLPPIDDTTMAAARRIVNAKAGPVSVYDFTSEGTKRSRVVGGLASVEGNTWFIKMSGDAAAVEAAKPEFLRLLGSLRRD